MQCYDCCLFHTSIAHLPLQCVFYESAVSEVGHGYSSSVSFEFALKHLKETVEHCHAIIQFIFIISENNNNNIFYLI